MNDFELDSMDGMQRVHDACKEAGVFAQARTPLGIPNEDIKDPELVWVVNKPPIREPKLASDEVPPAFCFSYKSEAMIGTGFLADARYGQVSFDSLLKVAVQENCGAVLLLDGECNALRVWRL